MTAPELLYPQVEQAVRDLGVAVRQAVNGEAPAWPAAEAALAEITRTLAQLKALQAPVEPMTGLVKQVLVIRKDLPMPTGKQVGQGAHGAVNALAKEFGAYVVQVGAGHELRIPLDRDAKAWLDTNYRKIVVGIKSERALLALYDDARAAGLRCHLVRDDGLTVFDGEKPYTALALGPHEDAVLDKLTKPYRLQLLGAAPVPPAAAPGGAATENSQHSPEQL
jgi:PTH2 family peptidyl-tRNA hydrolase